jgi:hypothetical protein
MVFSPFYSPDFEKVKQLVIAEGKQARNPPILKPNFDLGFC